MQTGDGWLVRLSPIGTIPLDAFRRLCVAARQHGNGVVEVTSRGSIQVRGLSVASAPRFAAAIAALDIAAADGTPVVTNALAGLGADEVLDAAALAADLRRDVTRAALAARLAPKVSIAIDGGGAPNLDRIAADVRLGPATIDGRAMLGIGVGGDGSTAAWLGHIAPAHGVTAAMRLLQVLAQRGRSARARDVVAAEGAAPFRVALEGLMTAAHAGETGGAELACQVRRNERTTVPIGPHPLRDRSLACGVGLAFGHADATTLERLADAAHSAGALGMRAAPGRALMIIGMAEAAGPAFADAAAALGLIVGADDPRRHVIACAGAPICSSAHIAARAIAPIVSRIAAPQLNAARQIHISGCAKGCAHGGAAALTVVGVPDGCALIANGSVRDTPYRTISADALPAAITQFVHRAREGDHG